MFCYPFSLSRWYNISMNYGCAYFIYYSKQILLQNIGHRDKPVVAFGKAESIFNY